MVQEQRQSTFAEVVPEDGLIRTEIKYKMYKPNKYFNIAIYRHCWIKNILLTQNKACAMTKIAPTQI